MKKIFSKFLILPALALILAFPVHAQELSEPVAGPGGLLTGLEGNCNPEFGPVSDSCQSCATTGDCGLCDIIVVADNIITLVLSMVGVLALVAFIWGGLQIMTQGRLKGGDQKENVQAGFKTIKYAIIGIALVFFSYAIVNFGLNILIGSGSGDFNYGNVAEIFGTKWAEVCDIQSN